MTPRRPQPTSPLRAILRILAVIGAIGVVLIADGLLLKAEEHLSPQVAPVTDAPATQP